MLNPLLDHLSDYPFDRLRSLLEGLRPPEGLRPHVLSVGEPRHAPPPVVAEALAARAGDWGRYPPVEGTPDFRRAVVDWLTRRYRLPPGLVDPEREVLPVSGTREALFLIAQAIVPEEKNGSAPAVLMPNPFYQVYLAAAVFGRAEPVFLPATSFGGSCDLSRLDVALLDRTAMMYLCSPANPQGTVASLDSLKLAVELARAHDFVLCVDECYTDIYDRVPPPGALQACAELGKSLDNVVVFESLSKRSNVPGLRSGFVAGDARLIRAFRRLRAFGGASVPLPVLHASALLWRDDAHAEANRSLYRAKFDLAEGLLADRFGFARPAGGFFVWLQVGDGEQAARALWSRAALRVLPGAYLAKPSRDGKNPAAGYIRIALVDDLASTEDALRMLLKVL
jgi:N-succinyldiaminopimelate aminotransferase